MKYTITLLAFFAFASCDTEKRHQCDCTSIKGQTLYTYHGDYKKAIDGVPACEAAEDSIALAYPDAGVQCYFYRVEN